MRVLVLCIFVVLFSSLVVNAGMVQRSKTTMIVVHHSDSDQGNVEIFRRYHVGHNGWDDIGYHYVVCNGRGGDDGEIQTGRQESLQGAHAGKSGINRNAISVGVCLVGKGNFTTKQKAALLLMLVELCRKYDIVPSTDTIQSHHGDCPGKNLGLDAIITQVQEEINK